MNKKILKITMIIFIMLFLMFLLKTTSLAASFNASISRTEVNVGDTITVTVSANNAAGLYDVSINNSNLSKTNGDASEFIENESKTITYKATKEGTTTITAKANDMTDSDDDTKKVTGSKTFTVTIKSKKNNNSNNNNSNSTSQPKKGTLSSCKINGITVKKDLSVTNKESVSVVVNTSTKEGATIYNNLTKKSYKVKSGASTEVKILEGTNTLTITLDSGEKSTRKIYSQKEEVVEPNTIEEPEEEIKPEIKTLTIKDFNLEPLFSSDVFEYVIRIPADQEEVTKLDLEAIANNKDFEIEITGNENFKEGENIVTIVVKTKNGEKIATYRITVIKEVKEEEVVPAVAQVEEPPQEEPKKELDIRKLIVIIFTAVVAVAGLVFAFIEYKYGGKNEEEDSKIPFSHIDFEKEEPEIPVQEKENDFNEFRSEILGKEENYIRQNMDTDDDFGMLYGREDRSTRRGKHF